jgi:Rrf2 family protein
MKTSRTAAYAIHAVLYVAQNSAERPVAGHEAAADLSIPEGFLLRLLVMLSRARLLHSMKGPHGGYRLARPAAKITILDIMEAVEGPLHGRAPAIANNDGLNRKLTDIAEQATESERKLLAGIRVSDLVTASKKKR